MSFMCAEGYSRWIEEGVWFSSNLQKYEQNRTAEVKQNTVNYILISDILFTILRAVQRCRTGRQI